MNEKLYTTDEVAEICRVSTHTVRRWLREGVIEAARPGRAYLISESTLKKHLEEKHG